MRDDKASRPTRWSFPNDEAPPVDLAKRRQSRDGLPPALFTHLLRWLEETWREGRATTRAGDFQQWLKALLQGWIWADHECCNSSEDVQSLIDQEFLRGIEDLVPLLKSGVSSPAHLGAQLFTAWLWSMSLYGETVPKRLESAAKVMGCSSKTVKKILKQAESARIEFDQQSRHRDLWPALASVAKAPAPADEGSSDSPAPAPLEAEPLDGTAEDADATDEGDSADLDPLPPELAFLPLVAQGRLLELRELLARGRPVVLLLGRRAHALRCLCHPQPRPAARVGARRRAASVHLRVLRARCGPLGAR